MTTPKVGIFVLILGGCLGPTMNETRVELTDAQWVDYWSQLERRWPDCWPDLPLMNDVRQAVTFVEVPHEQLETCTYNNGKIRIGDDKWVSGCVPHEMGHAACHLLKWDGCAEFEHPGYESQCR